MLQALVDVYHRAEDIRSLQSVAQQLLDLDPNDPDLYLMLAGCYLSNVLPALSI